MTIAGSQLLDAPPRTPLVRSLLSGPHVNPSTPRPPRPLTSAAGDQPREQLRPCTSQRVAKSAVPPVTSKSDGSDSFQGECDNMCPAWEMEERVRLGDLHDMERGDPRHPGRGPKELMVKKFERDASRLTTLGIPQRTLLRTLPALERSQAHLVDQLGRRDVVRGRSVQWHVHVCPERDGQCSGTCVYVRRGVASAVARACMPCGVRDSPGDVLKRETLAVRRCGAGDDIQVQLCVGPLQGHPKGHGPAGHAQSPRSCAPGRAAGPLPRPPPPR